VISYEEAKALRTLLGAKTSEQYIEFVGRPYYGEKEDRHCRDVWAALKEALQSE